MIDSIHIPCADETSPTGANTSAEPTLPSVFFKESKNKIQQFSKEQTIKFTKRENVDKKILRKFKKYLKELKKKNKLPKVSEFWNLFIIENLMPPMALQNSAINENVNFKSFNTIYILWLFSHLGGVELYDIFLAENKNAIISAFESLLIDEEDRKTLDNYVNNFAHLYTYQLQKQDLETLTAYSEDSNNNISVDEFPIGQKNIYDMVFETDFPVKYLVII
jgi:hypothetical protein